ncbi:MAG: hypothetical protein KDA65_16905 [Planctomycetaceae bacterium]|nr:hypothetical protein [Planctomycetaceae bacterium]
MRFPPYLDDKLDHQSEDIMADSPRDAALSRIDSAGRIMRVCAALMMIPSYIIGFVLMMCVAFLSDGMKPTNPGETIWMFTQGILIIFTTMIYWEFPSDLSKGSREAWTNVVGLTLIGSLISGYWIIVTLLTHPPHIQLALPIYGGTFTVQLLLLYLLTHKSVRHFYAKVVLPEPNVDNKFL